jgi:hypothetical protein
VEERAVAHIAKGSDGDTHTLVLVSDGALGWRFMADTAGHEGRKRIK